MLFTKDHLFLFILGNVVAFIVAMLAIKFFIGVLKKYGFKMWGWYRIVLGIAFIVYYSFIK
jgi:undecaprenyl-diphosphatase